MGPQFAHSECVSRPHVRPQLMATKPDEWRAPHRARAQHFQEEQEWRSDRIAKSEALAPTVNVSAKSRTRADAPRALPLARTLAARTTSRNQAPRSAPAAIADS